MEYVLVGSAFLVGCLLGWIGARGYSRTEGKNAEQIISQVQDQNRLLQTERDDLRQRLENDRIDRARLETRLEETQHRLTEQKALIEESARKLTDTFKALSLDALSENNRSFLVLAQKTLQITASEITGDLEKRKQAIDALIKPLDETLKRYEVQILEMEKSRSQAYGDITRHMEELVRTQEQLKDQTRSLQSALRE
ncbi:MAG: DNA recombination protein RmuC, partial [Desulfomonilia bacterium]|nr:DNA recombination protein RmuC [Desulfomonilia bacterium]